MKFLSEIPISKITFKILTTKFDNLLKKPYFYFDFEISFLVNRKIKHKTLKTN